MTVPSIVRSHVPTQPKSKLVGNPVPRYLPRRALRRPASSVVRPPSAGVRRFEAWKTSGRAHKNLEMKEIELPPKRKGLAADRRGLPTGAWAIKNGRALLERDIEEEPELRHDDCAALEIRVNDGLLDRERAFRQSQSRVDALCHFLSVGIQEDGQRRTL